MLTLALATLLLCPADKPLPPRKAREFRALLTTVLAEPDAAQRRKIAAAAAAFEEEYRFADLVAAVRQGPLLPAGAPQPRTVAGESEELVSVGDVVVGYSFAVDGQVYRYAVDVPPRYDPARPHGVLLDPGHGSGKGQDAEGKAGFLGMYRRHADAAKHADWLIVRTEIIEQIGGDGARGQQPEEAVMRVFDAFFRDLCSRFHVDLAHVVPTGISQTGYWAWYLGTGTPDRWSGIAPMSATTWQADRYLDNLRALPTYVLHGDDDSVCAVDQPRGTTARLARMGAPVLYDEIAGAAHDYGVWQHLPRALAWLAEHPRERYPARVSKSVQTLAAPWCHFVRLDALAAEGNGKAGQAPTAGVDAEIDGRTIRLFSEGVTRLTVCVPPQLAETDEPLTIVWNGKTVHEARVTPRLATLLEIAGEKVDWSAVYVAAIELRP